MLLDQKTTGDTWRNVTCRWIKANRAIWQKWIPDESECFAGFGLYDTVLQDFADARVNATNKIVCQAGCVLVELHFDNLTSSVQSHGKELGIFGTRSSLRSDFSVLLCWLFWEACPPGMFSQALEDNKGVTHICVACGKGTSQSSGASLSCAPCKAGLIAQSCCSWHGENSETCRRE